MTDEKRDRLTEEELREADGEPLPSREVMTVVSGEPTSDFLDLELGTDPPPGSDTYPADE